MGFVTDFRAFALKGNVMDLAVGVIIGAAFGKIVSALVDDILMPLISMVTGGTNFNDLHYVLKPGSDGATSYPSLEAAKAAGANVFAYGHFIQSVVDFLIIAACIFLIIRAIGRMVRRREEVVVVEAPSPSSTDVLLTEIRDELRRKA
jgi:large conductance mechanosensitive channel